MRSLSTKPAFGILAAVLVVAALVGVTWDYAREQRQVRAHAAAITGGDPTRGEAMFIEYGCGSCHALKNVRTATGNVGPPLDGIATRVIVAGHLANNPANMEHWIRDPQQVSPGTAMPDLNVSQGDARDITAFLYTRH
jgi:cytochrome c2